MNLAGMGANAKIIEVAQGKFHMGTHIFGEALHRHLQICFPKGEMSHL